MAISRAWRWATLVVLAGASLLAGGPAAETPPKLTTFPTMTRGPEAAELFGRVVTDLASPDIEGRGPKTKGVIVARDYIAGHFRRMGLRPAFGGSYLQPFPMPLGGKVGEQSLAILDADGEPAGKVDARREFYTLGFSASGSFEGEAVFAGYGIVSSKRKYDSYGEDADAVKGKVVIVYRYEPMDNDGRSLWGRTWSRDAGLVSKAKWADQKGAKAILVVNPPGQAKAPAPAGGASLVMYGIRTRIPMMYMAGGLMKRILRAAGRKDPAAAMRAFQADADNRKGGLVPLGGLRLRGAVKVERIKVTLHNVAGVLGGAGKLANEYVIVGAHYDHIGYGSFGSRKRSGKKRVHAGADDNASGTAGVLLLARRFAHRAAGGDPVSLPSENRRSIIFAAFGGEEYGLYGSRYMAGHFDEMGISAGDVNVMVNLDMIGRSVGNRAYIWGGDSGDRLRAILAEPLAKTSLKVTVTGGGVGPSDNASFYRRKIPVLSFFTGIHKDYHTPGDTPEKINTAAAVEVLAIADAVLAQLWSDPQRTAYQPPKRGSIQAAMGLASDVYLGIVYEPLSDAKGCEIASVPAGGPAEKAGIQPGDIIVGWDDKEIEGLAQLLVALHGCKPKDVVTLRIKRDGKIIQLKVTLGKRGG